MLFLASPYIKGNGNVGMRQLPNETTPALQGQFAQFEGSTLIPSDGIKCCGVAGIKEKCSQVRHQEADDIGVLGESGLSVTVGDVVYVSANGLATNLPATGLRAGVFKTSSPRTMKDINGTEFDDCYLITLDRTSLDTAPAPFKKTKTEDK